MMPIHSRKPRKNQNSKHTSLNDGFKNYFLSFILLLYTFIILFGELIFLPESEKRWCQAVQQNNLMITKYENPDYNTDPCRHEHHIYLLYMSINECDHARRMLFSVILGSIIGYERTHTTQNRPAGIRTMGLVSLGSCFFTISSMVAFRSSTMGWDSARVAAAIPSGVGFLGAGLIWKVPK